MDKIGVWRKAIANALKAERAAAGLGIKELAAALGWGSASISRYEAGERAITVEQAQQLAEFYGLTLVQFMQKIEERYAQLAAAPPAFNPADYTHAARRGTSRGKQLRDDNEDFTQDSGGYEPA